MFEHFIIRKVKRTEKDKAGKILIHVCLLESGNFIQGTNIESIPLKQQWDHFPSIRLAVVKLKSSDAKGVGNGNS